LGGDCAYSSFSLQAILIAFLCRLLVGLDGNYPSLEGRQLKEVRVDLPYFHGKENVEAYLDWEMKVEQLFACHRVSEERKVPLTALSFQGNVMYW